MATIATDPPPAPATPPPVPPPAPVVGAPPAGDTIQVPRAYYEELYQSRQRLGELERAHDERVRAAEQAKAEALLKAGDLEKGMGLLKEKSEREVQAEKDRYAALEGRARRYALENSLADALAGYEFSSAEAQQMARNEIAKLLEVHPDGDKFVVRTATFVPTGEVVKEFLSREGHQCLLRARTQGGTGNTQGGGRTSPTPAASGTPAPQLHELPTLGHQLLATLGPNLHGARGAPPGANPALAAADVSQPFALKPQFLGKT